VVFTRGASRWCDHATDWKGPPLTTMEDVVEESKEEAKKKDEDVK
jgi:hypothetical protein